MDKNKEIWIIGVKQQGKGGLKLGGAGPGTDGRVFCRKK